MTAAAPMVTQTNVTSSFGAWTIAAGSDGRLVATARLANPGGPLRELRIECRTGGRLEYVPVTADGTRVQSIWLNSGIDDTQSQLQATSGRFSGAAAAELSKQFLAAEADAKRNGAAGEWAFEITVNDSNSSGSNIQAAGFSRMRAHMLANCKS
jgi:hypothetical protein